MPSIILTCGPSCEDEKILTRMSAIADGFRLNTAHLSQDKLEWWLNRLTGLQNSADKPFAVFLDLQGAKIRIGSYPACKQLSARVELFFGDCSTDEHKIPVWSKSLFESAEVGDLLMLNDRRVILRVVKIASSECLVAETVKNGPLSSKKGLSSPDKIFELSQVPPSDLAAIRLGRAVEGLEVKYALSYVVSGREASLYKGLVGTKAYLTAKTEHPTAIKHAKNLASHGFRAAWFCRGDMGANAGLKMLGRLQNEFVNELSSSPMPIILAGEVLGSMTVLPYPSRAEVVQLYNALSQGFSGIVLSDETACGCHVEDVLDFIEYYFDRQKHPKVSFYF